MSGGGGGGPTQTTVTQSNIPDWLRPQVETVLGGATKELFKTQQIPGAINPETGEAGPPTYDITGTRPYIPYSASPMDYVAPFSPLQEQAMYNIANLQMPMQYLQGSDLAGMAGYGGLGAAEEAAMYGGLGYGAGQAGQRVGLNALQAAAGLSGQLADTAQMYGGRAAMAGPQYEYMATSPYAMSAYMSPYMQNVVDVQQQEARRQSNIANQARKAQFAQAGAFGGSRFGIQQQQAAADLARQQQAIQAQGLQQAFQQAQQAQQFGANLGLQGLAGAQQGVGQAISAGQMGLQGAGLGLQGTGQAMQGAGIGLQGVQGGLGGYGLTGQMAGTLGQLGTQQLAAQQGILGLQQQAGAAQQAQQQQMINQAIQNFAQAQEAPYQTLSQYNALLRGYAMPGQTTTQYQAQPTLSNQLVGLGTAGIGAAQLSSALGKKSGGIIDLSLHDAMKEVA
jgi:hypothetical protein